MTTAGRGNRVLAHVGAGMAGGMIGFVIVGLAEALVVLLQATSLTDLGVLPFAVVAYGLSGAAGGAGLGVVVGLVAGARPGAFGAYLAAFFFVGAAVIGRFRVARDVFNEQMPHGLVPMLAQVLAFAALGVVTIGLGVLARRLTSGSRGRFLMRPLGAGLAVGGLAMITGIAAVIPALVIRPAPPPVREAPAGAPPIILIMVDTLRADYLSSYGATDVRTPATDRLAADGVRFTHAFSQASWTRPSVATILTSLYPSSHGAVHKVDILGNSVQTLAEVLQGRGYHTIGFANNANVSPAFNFQQGFDEYTYLAPAFYFYASESAAELIIYKQLRLVRERFLSQSRWVRNYYQPAAVVTDRALATVAGAGDKPFFLFLHYMDAHDPYFAHPFDGRAVARVATPHPREGRAAELKRLYAGEIEYMDEHLSRLFDGLRAQGLYDRAMIVLTADHGEEFFEHGGWWHGTTLYDEQTNVPLIIKLPHGVHRGRVVNDIVRSLDVTPTILRVAGARASAQMQGRSLVPLRAADTAPDAAFSEEELEGNVLRAVRTSQWKLMVANPGNPRGLAPNQLFDLKVDPGEKANLFGRGDKSERAMRATLERLEKESRKYARAVEHRSVDRATQERLKALGYVD